MEKTIENNIPIINDGFRPSTAEISYMMDELLVRAESGDQDAGELYKQAETSLFNLVDIWNITQNWLKFKKAKKIREKREVAVELMKFNPQ